LKSQPRTANVQHQIVSEQEEDTLSNIAEEQNSSNDSVVVDETKESNINNVVNEVQTSQDTRPLTNKRKKYKLSKTLRQLVWKQYVGMQIGETLCVCCKSNTINCFDFQCGHVVARANGGDDTVDNIRPICPTCNGSMGTMNMRDFAERVCKVKIV
jgi:5-methylcytosine-specific restriction endonuclease McrA